MNLEFILAGVILISLTFYVLMGGADYGAGVLSLLARGPSAPRQRELIATAIGPIWEANHVWLILIVTVLFTAFPPAFASITTTLHIPLTVMLVGIVLRGSAFAFRTNDVVSRTALSEAHVLWDRVFALSSLLTSILLGVTIGAIASGRLVQTNGGFLDVFVYPWFSPFPFAVGLLALALFTFLAAVYLILETTHHELREVFRRRALAAAVVVGVLAAVVFVLSWTEAPEISAGLADKVWGRLMLIAAAISAVVAAVCLWKRWFRPARMFAVGEVTCILWGWALAQYPFLIEPHMTISNAAAPAPTLRWLLAALVCGALLLFPSLYYLYRIFKRRAVFGDPA
jgi:cytochrome d ubiquinol oxidase subunit II